MNAEVQRLLDSIADLREKASVNAAFGEPVTIEGRTVIPVAKVGYGFGMGVGHSRADVERGVEPDVEADVEKAALEETVDKADAVGSSGGGAVQARPFAIVEVTSEGTRVEPIVDEQKLALAGSLLIGWSVFCLARTLVKIFGGRE
jgi:uncharacterized spore protein YtfJ